MRPTSPARRSARARARAAIRTRLRCAPIKQGLRRSQHAARQLGPELEGALGATNELASLRFITAGQHVVMVPSASARPSFLAHAIGHIACRRKHPVITVSADWMLKRLRHARLDHTCEAEMGRLLAVDLLIIDDFGLDAMNANGSRDIYEIMVD